MIKNHPIGTKKLKTEELDHLEDGADPNKVGWLKSEELDHLEDKVNPNVERQRTKR